jgi:hypothetical protein
MSVDPDLHRCTACSCAFSEDEGGVVGDFGILPMAFCPTCLACMLDMAAQLDPREWQSLSDAEYQEILVRHDGGGLLAFYNLIEEKLRELNE